MSLRGLTTLALVLFALVVIGGAIYLGSTGTQFERDCRAKGYDGGFFLLFGSAYCYEYEANSDEYKRIEPYYQVMGE